MGHRPGVTVGVCFWIKNQINRNAPILLWGVSLKTCKNPIDFWYIRPMKHYPQYIDIEIDRLTNSIENRITGDSFQTDVSLIDKDDLKLITKKNGWLFDWKNEHKQPDRDVYKLTTTGNSIVIQGLVSITEREDHVYMHLIECAPFNLGKNKMYLGVPGNLVAFVCRISFHRGFDGYVSFTSKTQLIDHYKTTLGAINIGGQLMVINTDSVIKLIDKYFKN